MPFTLSIETDAGTYQHGYHLGTQEPLARAIAENIFAKYRPRQGSRIVTVALKWEHKMFDVYDGEWSSERDIFQDETA
jgi:hypothetical protein